MADIPPDPPALNTTPVNHAPPSPPQGSRKRRRPVLPSSSESEGKPDTESESSSTESSEDEARDLRGGRRRSPRELGGRYFLDLSAESTTGTESEGTGPSDDDDDDASDGWLVDTPPRKSKRPRINLRLTSSPDRRAGVVFPEVWRNDRPIRAAQPQAPAQSSGDRAAAPRRSARQAQMRSGAAWTLDLHYIRQCVNQLFRILRAAPNPPGSANRLRHLVRDCYLMGYCRTRLGPRTWGRLLQISGGTWDVRLRNAIREVEARFEPAAEPVCELPCLNARRYGPECDVGNLETNGGSTSDDEISDATDSDDTLASHSDTEGGPSPAGRENPESASGGAIAARLECEFGTFDWTSEEGSQPWLSAVVADTSSAERSGIPAPGACRATEAPEREDGCRKMRFPAACPYPCGHTFLRP